MTPIGNAIPQKKQSIASDHQEESIPVQAPVEVPIEISAERRDISSHEMVLIDGKELNAILLRMKTATASQKEKA